MPIQLQILFQLILIAMLRRLVHCRFTTFKNQQKNSKTLLKDMYISSRNRELRPYLLDKNAIPIDISKCKLEEVPDTRQLQQCVLQLEHGLDQHLNGELVFGDKGVGRLPQQSDYQSNKQISSLSGYVHPSEDKDLLAKATQNNCKYLSSTSSISNPLIALYFIFSNFRLPNMENIYSGVISKPTNWMISYRKPTTFFLKPLENGKEAIVSDKGLLPMSNEVLMNLGHIVEFFLTHKNSVTNQLMRGELDHYVPTNYYRYAIVNEDIILRSQIDCMSYDEEGKPYVFEIKSRACAPIRYDIVNYKNYTDYEINSKRGLIQSFERQYFDLIRGGFLKYVMQVKIGRMDGAFIAYHNTQKIYGYEYVKLKQMALRVFGDDYNLDVSFVCISKMLTVVLDTIREQLKQFKGKNLKVGFYSEYKFRKLIVMVEPMSEVTSYQTLTFEKAASLNIVTLEDYYSKVIDLKNPVYKFQFDFYIYFNGIRLLDPEVLFTPHDSLELKYTALPKKRVSKTEYLAFLREAYKDEDIFNSLLYKGMWGYQFNHGEKELQ